MKKMLSLGLLFSVILIPGFCSGDWEHQCYMFSKEKGSKFLGDVIQYGDESWDDAMYRCGARAGLLIRNDKTYYKYWIARGGVFEQGNAPRRKYLQAEEKEFFDA